MTYYPEYLKLSKEQRHAYHVLDHTWTVKLGRLNDGQRAYLVACARDGKTPNGAYLSQLASEPEWAA